MNEPDDDDLIHPETTSEMEHLKGEVECLKNVIDQIQQQAEGAE